MGPHVTPTLASKAVGRKSQSADEHTLDTTHQEVEPTIYPKLWQGSKTLSQQKNSSAQGSSSPSATGAAVIARPNAAASDNMAPALTEPLSPTEKLSSSTAKATPTTRSSKKGEVVATTSAAAGAANLSATTPTSVKEKRSRTIVPATTTTTSSTRVTRSKDAYQRIFEQAITPSVPPEEADISTTPPALASSSPTSSPNTNCDSAQPKLNSKNEEMGLSAALNNNNNEPNDLTGNRKENSTQQLIADLTNDIEEAITNDIFLRKQTVIKAGQGEAAEAASHSPKSLHMESPHVAETNELKSDEIKETDSKETKVAASETPQIPKTDATARLHILSVEELPPISTDSTMTASEVEDNLEERLSQLDGTAIISSTNLCGADHSADATLCPVPSTPPKTPTRQLTHLQLQQQLQQTPPTPLSQQVQQQQNVFTPQSTSSSLNTLGSVNLPQGSCAVAAAGELEDQDLEEVLKVLKGFDGNDFNVLFNELNDEEIGSSQPASSTTTVMSMSMTPTSAKPNPLKDMQADIEKQQQTMQRKIDFLVRRLRKTQARYMAKHASEEIAGLFEWSARFASRGGNASTTSGTMLRGETLGASVIAARPHALNWIEEKRNPVPATQMTAMLRKLETVANTQQLCTSGPSSNSSSLIAHTQLKKSKKALMHDLQMTAASSSEAPAALNESRGETVVPTFDPNVTEEITHVTGLLQTEMREVQNAIDSDATESSSGGESADEMVTYNNQIQQPLSIAKRAAWRYSRDRAAIASRWSWLLSQIADLEIKIRQHSELHQEMVRAKGSVTCDDESDTKALDVAGASVTCTGSVNGYNRGTAGISAAVKPDGANETTLPGACRTRGYTASQFRKRKLFQTTNLHTISKKAARPSTIKCGCQWPVLPCALCTGRTDPTAPRDLPDTMMMAERVALLDPGYHPVLSFREDVSNSIHLEAISRLPEWQQRIMRCQVKSIAKSVWKAEREAAAAAGGQHSSKKYGGEPTQKRRYIKKKDRLAAEEKAAAAAAAAAGTAPGGAGVEVGVAASGTPANAGAACGEGAAQASSDAGNGTATLSTSTTPLVANKLAKNSKKLHCHLVGDGILLEPLSPVPTNNSNHSQSSNSNYIHQTSDYPPTNYDQFNPNPTHSSLISSSSSSSKNSKYRKLSSTSATNAYLYNHHYPPASNNQYHYYNSNGNSEGSFLHTNDNWDNFAARSRTSSPTHGGGSSNYHKYERSLDRKNRSSYDIDNIVIPYSVAAATRVEILPYKEIPTPKWRVINDENEAVTSDDSTKLDTKLTADLSNAIALNGLSSQAEETTANCDDTELASAENSMKVDDKSDKAVSTDGKENLEAVALESNNIDAKPKSKSPECNKQNNVLKKPTLTTDTEIAGKEQSPTGKESSNEVETKMEEISAEPVAKKTKVDTAPVEEPKDDAATNSASCDATEPQTEQDNAEDNTATDKKHSNCDENNCSTHTEEEDEDEDICDEAMKLRHERALTEERRKFQTFLKFPWSTRSRANRRIDSRAESSGANTPDPTSPAPHTPSVGGGDQESIPSPLAPSTPLNPLDSVSEAGENVTAISMPAAPTTGVSAVSNSSSSFNNNFISTYVNNSKRYERRRTTSTKKDRELERRSSTPDPKELIPPYEPLEFPLPDDVFDNLLKAMPNDYQDDSKYFEDCNNMNYKITRNRIANPRDVNIKRVSKSATINCDVNNRRQRINNSMNHKTSDSIGGPDTSSATLGDFGLLTNGKEDSNNMLIDDYAEDDYPKHHLAPDNDIYQDGAVGGGGGGIGMDENDYIDDEYGAYVGVRTMLGDSDGESSETEPFQDDDPNDPEWKGETEERSERLRKKA